MPDQKILLYLLGINLLGAAAAALQIRRREKWNAVVIALALAGGAPGVLLVSFLWDRRAVKENMTVRVVSICALVVQILCALFLRAPHRSLTALSLTEFFGRYPLLLLYLLLVNIITFTAFGVDKRRAIRNGPRLRIVTLLGLAAAGGCIGGLAGMYVFRHKTRQPYFFLGLPCILVTHAAMLFVFLLYFQDSFN